MFKLGIEYKNSEWNVQIQNGMFTFGMECLEWPGWNWIQEYYNVLELNVQSQNGVTYSINDDYTKTFIFYTLGIFFWILIYLFIFVFLVGFVKSEFVPPPL